MLVNSIDAFNVQEVLAHFSHTRPDTVWHQRESKARRTSIWCESESEGLTSDCLTAVQLWLPCGGLY